MFPATFDVSPVLIPKGLYAATFYTLVPPSDTDTWPVTLPIAICSIAFLTCMLANGLLAQSAILSRNKLAEIVWTRRKLWRTMAEKELAEASAATRSSFIASASHEIRTPLHHLQGYTDLLARSELKAEDRKLLIAIQSATRTLSLSKCHLSPFQRESLTTFCSYQQCFGLV